MALSAENLARNILIVKLLLNLFLSVASDVCIENDGRLLITDILAEHSALLKKLEAIEELEFSISVNLVVVYEAVTGNTLGLSFLLLLFCKKRSHQFCIINVSDILGRYDWHNIGEVSKSNQLFLVELFSESEVDASEVSALASQHIEVEVFHLVADVVRAFAFGFEFLLQALKLIACDSVSDIAGEATPHLE